MARQEVGQPNDHAEPVGHEAPEGQQVQGFSWDQKGDMKPPCCCPAFTQGGRGIRTQVLPRPTARLQAPPG